MFIRTSRRTPGTRYARTYGPWHISRADSVLTWCGAAVMRSTAAEVSESPEAGERRCAECAQREAANQPRPGRGRGKRH